MSFYEKWRFGIKCMKYSYNLTINLIAAGVILVLGFIYELLNISSSMATFNMMVSVIFPVQLLYSVGGSQLVQSSPHRKAMMTSLPAIMTLGGNVVVYLLSITVQTVRAMRNQGATEKYVYAILTAGIVIFYMNIYVGAAFKYFWISAVLLWVCAMSFDSYIGFLAKTRLVAWIISRCSLPVAIITGLCLVLLGSLLQYGISLLLYKKPISKTVNYATMLRQGR